MYQPLFIDQIAKQHIAQLHAEAAADRLRLEARQARKEHRAAGKAAHAKPSRWTTYRAVARQLRRRLRLVTPAIVERASMSHTSPRPE